MILTIFIITVLFDILVLSVTTWLVGYKDWSAWWFVFAVFVCQAEWEGAKTLLERCQP